MAIKTFIVHASMTNMNLKSMISDYPGFPKEGIIFRDFSPILRDPAAMTFAADEFARYFDPGRIDLFAGIESRGFILSSALSSRYNRGMIMIRKAGKLPGSTIKRSYELEYGEGTLEIQTDAVSEGQKVMICDDLLATGGTARAAGELVESAGGVIAGYLFFIELTGLGGAASIMGYKYTSLVQY